MKETDLNKIFTFIEFLEIKKRNDRKHERKSKLGVKFRITEEKNGVIYLELISPEEKIINLKDHRNSNKPKRV